MSFHGLPSLPAQKFAFLTIQIILGSAIYVLGDKKNDHGIYSVALDNGPLQYYNGTSGCGGAYGMTCEQQHPTMAYLASNLDNSLHNITIENHTGVNASYFGVSYFTLFTF